MENQWHSLEEQPTRAGSKLLVIAFVIAVFVLSAGAVATFFATSAASSRSSQTAAAASAKPRTNPFAGITIQAKAAYVEDLSTGRVLYQRNATASLPLASLTKIAMALAVTGVLPGNLVITLPKDAPAPDSTSTRLLKGQRWRESDLLGYTLMVSANDGADILAGAANAPIHARYPQSPAADATLWRMNEIAKQLGLHDMYFLNDNGLDISTTQSGAYGSARDVARLIAYAATTTPATFAATTYQTRTFTSVGGASVKAENTDKALGAIPGLIVGKTGYTDLAGGNLAVVFDVGLSHPVVAVVLGSTFDGRFTDMKKLITAAQQAVQQSP